MPRFCKVVGKPGALVPNPHAMNSDPPRYAGQKLKAQPPEDPEGLSCFYEPCEEIVEWHDSLHKAASKGDLVMVARCDAKDRGAAAKKMSAQVAPKMAPVAPKAGE